MKITVNAKKLKKAIGIAGVCTSKLSTMQEMTKVHLLVCEGKLFAYGHDGICAVETVIEDATIEGTGICSIEGALVSNVLNSVNDDNDVVIESSTQTNTTELISGSLKMSMPVFQSDIDLKRPEGKGMPIDVGMLAAVAHACALPESNQAIAENVCVKFGEKGIATTATDAHRISSRGVFVGDDKEILIPVESVKKICKLFALSDNVKIYASNTRVWISDGRTVFDSALSNGLYFKIQTMLDIELKNTVEIPRKDWISALKPYTSISKRCVIVNVDKKTVNLSVSSSEIKTSLCNDFPVESISVSKGVKFGCNPDFLVQALESIPDEYVTMHIDNEGNKPFYFEGEGYKEIIMPVVISD